MILLIVLIVLIAVVVVIILCVNDNSSITSIDDKNISPIAKYEEYPTLHSRCSNSCGGDLICDITAKRCKKQVHGDCAMDVDCGDGLVCRNWKCSYENNDANITFNDNTPEKKKDKSVRWKSTNETFYI